MKKRIITLISLIMSLLLVFSMSACVTIGGHVSGPEIDKNKTQLYVHGYNGGNGVVWLDEMAAEWNEKNDKYQIIVVAEKTTEKVISDEITTGSGAVQYSIYFSGVSAFQDLVYQDYLEDLSDLLSVEVDGAGKGTVGDKISKDYYDTWKRIASKDGQGMYMLPLADNFGLMIFDFESFLDKGLMIYADANDANVLSELTAQGVAYEKDGNLLVMNGDYTGSNIYFNYEIGDKILSCGKDGVYGTYDDGQPITEAEFDVLINKIKLFGDKSKAFVWSSMYPAYTDLVLSSAMVQYMGIEEEQTYYTYDGPITIDGQTEQIDLDTGYKVFGNDGFKKAVEFCQKYLNNATTAHSQALTGTSLSHTDAQSLLLYSYQAEAENLEHAHILIDGEWFENESRANFIPIENDGRGFGQREYRVLLLPNFEGQKGVDGNGNGSVVTCLNNGSIMVPKESDPDKLAAIKDFILMFLKDENLQRYTVESGSLPGYDFELTAEQYESLTPFSKNTYQIKRDKENVYMTRMAMLHGSDPLVRSSTLMTSRPFPYSTNGTPVASIIRALKDAEGNVDKVVNGAAKYYSQRKWSQIVQAAKDLGFYS